MLSSGLAQTVLRPTAETTTQKQAHPERQTKTELVLGMLRRDEGATLSQMVEATGWQPHTTRAALTGLKKKGHALSSEKVDGVRTYRAERDGGSA